MMIRLFVVLGSFLSKDKFAVVLGSACSYIGLHLHYIFTWCDTWIIVWLPRTHVYLTPLVAGTMLPWQLLRLQLLYKIWWWYRQSGDKRLRWGVSVPDGSRSKGTGSAKRSCPTGGTANGIPRYSSTVTPVKSPWGADTTRPRIPPSDVSTTTTSSEDSETRTCTYSSTFPRSHGIIAIPTPAYENVLFIPIFMWFPLPCTYLIILMNTRIAQLSSNYQLKRIFQRSNEGQAMQWHADNAAS